MHRLLRLGTIALLLSPVVARSQAPAAIVPGVRIRITEPGQGLHSGTVVAASADTVALKLDRGGATVPVFLARLSRLEVSQGRRRRTASGIVWGIPLGFAAG